MQVRITKIKEFDYDISVYNEDSLIRSNWRSSKTDAYRIAEEYANYYRDDNGQSADIIWREGKDGKI